MVNWQGSWIWSSENLPARNSYVRFRSRVNYSGGKADLHITADSRYVLYVNGLQVGFGPVRAWPNHWRYDTYDISSFLCEGENVIAMRVNHYGESTFQYNHGPAGLLFQLEFDEQTIASDTDWKASPDDAYISATPRISVQEAFEEQYDAREEDFWVLPDYDDSDWPDAISLRPALDGFHNNMEPRGIPFLTSDPVLPQRVLDREVVESVPYHFTIYTKPYFLPNDFQSDHTYAHGFLATQVWAPGDTDVKITQQNHKNFMKLKLNGQLIEDPKVKLKKGWNSLLCLIRGDFHSMEFGLSVDSSVELKFSAAGEKGGSKWAIIGPFELAVCDKDYVDNFMDPSMVPAMPMVPEGTLVAAEAIWQSGDVAALIGKPYWQEVAPEHVPAHDVWLRAYTDKVVPGEVKIEGEDAFLSGNEWATVYPVEGNKDVRILLDFGKEVVGFHRFEIDAPEGTIIDFHNFEFIQPDGRYNMAEGMNNSFRYICTDGWQEYETLIRRGFRYSYLILRDFTLPIKFRKVEAVCSTYPQSRRGNFACSDAQLDRIWEVGANTIRCCSEDTYTDCPTYEQTNWVGDARGEALIDWAVNGDPRLWYRGIEQTGDSLERSDITESNVPSGWCNILPAWTMLWMRSCREYVFFTGDMVKGRKLLDYMNKNIDGMKKYINSDGLFDIRAWNLFDWAAMDTPSTAIVTHQNCLAVHALRDAAEMAGWFGETALAEDWLSMAQSLSDAVNKFLWNDEKQAYTDCMRGKVQSPVFSQQTQTAASMSGTATGDRAKRCQAIMHNPPEGFVRAGSPFFEFFLLEAYQTEGKEQEFLDLIRRDWGFMVDMGATSFWEMWTATDLGFSTGDRLTRSHCHGWSAGPTFFLGTYTLGVRPGGVGYSPTIIEPHPADLKWCRGTVPTPLGNVEVQWENIEDKPFTMRVKAPECIELDIRLPREGSVTVNGKQR